MRKMDAIKAVEEGKFDYGYEVSIDDFAEMFGIKKPDILNKDADTIYKLIRKYELNILAAYGVMNNYLITIGRKLYMDGDMYKVANVDDTVAFIEKYYREGDEKYKKANKLRKSFYTIHPVTKEVDTMALKAATMEASSNRYSRHANL